MLLKAQDALRCNGPLKPRRKAHKKMRASFSWGVLYVKNTYVCICICMYLQNWKAQQYINQGYNISFLHKKTKHNRKLVNIQQQSK